MEKQIININDFIFIIKKRWILITSITILCTIISIIVTLFIVKPKYQTEIKLFIGKQSTVQSIGLNNRNNNLNNEAYNSSDVTMYQNLMKTYAQVISTNDLVKSALKSINQPTTDKNVSRVLKELTVTPSPDTQILTVQYESENKEELIPVINSIEKAFIKKAVVLIPNVNVQVIQSAQMPTYPSSPNKKLNVIIGFIIGILLSIAVVAILEYLNNTVKNQEDLEKLLGIPVIGNVPYEESL